MSGVFAGQRICVIGGTAGIGAAIARRAAAEGAVVIVGGRRGEAHDGPPEAETRRIDIGDPAGIEAFFAALGAVDHLVTTAAFVRPGPFKTGAVEDARISFEGKFWSQ